jgi:hypothetical protein
LEEAGERVEKDNKVFLKTYKKKNMDFLESSKKNR